jgi:hypothetical protein
MGVIARHDRDHLGPGDRILSSQAPKHPRHHPQQPVAVRHPMSGPQRLDGLAAGKGAEGLLDDLDALVHGEEGFDFGVVQEEEGHGGV